MCMGWPQLHMMLVVLMGLAAGMCKERPQLMMLVVLMGRAAAAAVQGPLL